MPHADHPQETLALTGGSGVRIVEGPHPGRARDANLADLWEAGRQLQVDGVIATGHPVQSQNHAGTGLAFRQG